MRKQWEIGKSLAEAHESIKDRGGSVVQAGNVA